MSLLGARIRRHWRSSLCKAVACTTGVILGFVLLSVSVPAARPGATQSHSPIRLSLQTTGAQQTRELSAVPAGEVVQPYRQLWRQLDSCGLQWQREYAELHKDIMTGRLPERTVVSVAVPSGMADRVLGTVGAFFYALLTRRALQLETWGDLPGFELALRPNKIDWRRPANAEPLPNAPWNATGKDIQVHSDTYSASNASGPAFDHLRFSYIHHFEGGNLGGESPDDLFVHGNFIKFPVQNPDATTIAFYSSRGRTVEMFQNPFHADQLRAWGLTPENAFSCAFMFLFQPVEAVAERMQPTLDALQLGDASILRIGIHIRLGDTEMTAGQALPEAVLEERAAAFWQCVQQIEDTRREGDQQVLWYLASDSLRTRRAAKQRYGDKLITDTAAEAVHVVCWDREIGCGQNSSRKADAIQCVPQNSGFGRLGAWLAREKKTIYSMPGISWEGYSSRNCSRGDEDSVEDMARFWSHFR